MNVVAVQPIHHTKSLQGDVVLLDGRLNILYGQAQCVQFFVVRNTDDFRTYSPADVHHSRLWKLFYALAHHPTGETSELRKS